MCLVVFAYRVHQEHELILLANRDEFHDRPSSPLQRWPQGFYAGRDDQAGGSWLGLHPDGRIAALTNVRSGPPTVSARSRGELVTSFLAATNGQLPADDIAARDYSGFNLLTGRQTADGLQLTFTSNRFPPRALSPGVYGLSNGDLDSNWPKVRIAKAALQTLLHSGGTPTLSWLTALANRDAAPDSELPDTGIGREKERWLSPCFIVSAGYGSVSSNLVLWARGRWQISERRYDSLGQTIADSLFSSDSHEAG